MSLALVQAHLQQYAAGSAQKATRANDPDTIAALRQAEAQFQRLAALVQAGMAELAAYQALARSKPASKRRAGRMTALEFWHRHGQAVTAIRAVYGDRWKVQAPFGETLLVTIPGSWASCRTERGTLIKWGPDHRMPAARYWPDGVLPEGLVVGEDYAREPELCYLVERWRVCAGFFRDAVRRRNLRFGRPWVEEEWQAQDLTEALAKVRRARAALAAAGGTPGWKKPERAPSWYRDRGYIWDGSEWTFEISVRNQQNREDQIERDGERARQEQADRAARLAAYAPQEGEATLEAAD